MTSCIDWEQRLIKGESIIPPPLFDIPADRALHIFKQLKVPDLPGQPTFGEVSDQWVFDFVRAVFGGYDEATGKQHITEYFMLISKKNTKSTIAAGIMLTALILCWRKEEEHLIIAPTKEVAQNSFAPAAAMVRADEELSSLFNIQPHLKTITHRLNNNTLKVVAADTDTVSGKKAGRILIDELWVFGKKANADGMLMEAMGGMVSRPEGWCIYLTTQSDDPPAGVFKAKLDYARDVRDGVIDDRKFLPVIYEFPKRMIESKEYLNPKNFYISNPNLGRSVSKEWIEDNLRKLQGATDGSLQKFLAKHLNIEIGLNLRNDRWAGADYWEPCADNTLTLDSLLERSEVCVIGIDGGGLDDLLGLCVMGRERGTRKWLVWIHAWAHKIALERRKEIAPRLKDFQRDGDLTVVDMPGQDVIHLCDIIDKVKATGLLPSEKSIGVDAAGIGEIVDELTSRGYTLEDIVGISQGWKMNAAIKSSERALAGMEVIHSGSPLMAWAVSNAKVTPAGNAVSITKQHSGSAKIDPLMAFFDAATLMLLNPACSGDKYQMFFV